MQRKPEDRVLPYNGQNMIDTNKTKAIDIIASVYMFLKTISNHNYQSLTALMPHTTMSPYIGIQSKPHSHVFGNWISVLNQGKR